MPSQPHRVSLLTYSTAAAALGIVWFVGLSWSTGTKRILAESDWWNFRLHPVELAAVLCAVSVSIALLFRRPIARSTGLLQHAALAIALPLVGTVFFTWGMALLGVALGRTSSNSAMHVVLYSVFMTPYAFVYVWYAMPTVLALGALSQAVLHMLAKRLSSPQADAVPNHPGLSLRD
jgi:hypothetical protein